MRKWIAAGLAKNEVWIGPWIQIWAFAIKCRAQSSVTLKAGPECIRVLADFGPIIHGESCFNHTASLGLFNLNIII